MHTIACFVELYEYLIEINLDNVIDIQEYQQLLNKQIKYILTNDTSLWDKEYVCKPSLFIHSKVSPFYIENKHVHHYHCIDYFIIIKKNSSIIFISLKKTYT